ncbi:DUF3093 domain-containing protein [Nocardioides oleivorans]|uniref:DUF3093 domain-containing protein n=1 Tax=Nocardioides oleivorans TaxID=273676 RepID=A0A4Q2RS54_9ACTN|nr:DUF3093 domain-containing protein [Nocardioides oleivorans]RYB91861.1 DUF3093 domain-containing protein [Nocardioides oleivorans]
MDYAERLSVPLRWWVQGSMMVASVWLAVLVATPDNEVIAWLVTALAFAVMVVLFVRYGGVRVSVDRSTFHAGRAHIALEHVGSVTALDAEGVRRQAGVDADARAYLLLRPYLKRGVKVEITDPADPAPYWLVSCRRPDLVVSALEAARTR